MEFLKKADYRQIKNYIWEMKLIGENAPLFWRYVGKVFDSATNVNMIKDREFNKICKALNRLKLSNDMKIFMRMFICDMTVKRIPSIDGELRIGHIFSQKALDMAIDDEMRKELSPSLFYKQKNILVTRGRRRNL